MRKNRRITLYNAGMLVLILIVYLGLGNCLGFSQDKVRSKFGEFADKFGSPFYASDFGFGFIYLCDRLTNYMTEEGIEFPSNNEEIKEVIRNIRDKRSYFLTVITLKIAELDPTKLVFVQNGQQFNIEKSGFNLIRGRICEEVYPGVLITGVLLLPLSFDPTIPATIWYKKERLGNFAINAEYSDLISILRKPVKIGHLDFKKETKEAYIIELVLEDEYGFSTKCDGVINCQLYSLETKGFSHYEEKELLYEKERKVCKKDFELDYPFTGKKEEKVFVYRWREKLEGKESFTSYMNGRRSSRTTGTTIGEMLVVTMPVAKFIISFTLPTGERLRATKEISRYQFGKG